MGYQILLPKGITKARKTYNTKVVLSDSSMRSASVTISEDSILTYIEVNMKEESQTERKPSTWSRAAADQGHVTKAVVDLLNKSEIPSVEMAELFKVSTAQLSRLRRGNIKTADRQLIALIKSTLGAAE